MARATDRPPAPMARLPMPPAVGVWESDPMRVLPGTAKFSRWSWWQMPVPGGGEHDAVFGGNAAQVAVVVGVAEAHLQGVVVHVADREFGLDPGQTDGLPLQVGHGARGVLGQGLVYRDGHFLAGAHVPVDEVRRNDLMGKALFHESSFA